MGQSYGQLSEQERCAIFRLHAGGISRGEIARHLGRHKSTIGRELRRNALPSGYQPVAAERMARARRWRGTKIERSSQLRATVDDQLIAMGRSPEQIAGRLEREQGKPVISHESIYRYIYGQHRPARPVHDRHEVKEAAADRDVGDVGRPHLVRPLDRQVAQQIRVDLVARRRRRRARGSDPVLRSPSCASAAARACG